MKNPFDTGEKNNIPEVDNSSNEHIATNTQQHVLGKRITLIQESAYQKNKFQNSSFLFPRQILRTAGSMEE